MSFSLSGSVVTQSGTDSNLSGMSGLSLTGLTYLASGSQRNVVFNATSGQLVVNGSLTIPADSDQLFFTQAGNNLSIQINNGGTLVLTNLDGGTYRNAYPVKGAKVGASWWHPGDSVVNVAAGGTLQLLGAGIRSQTPINISGTIYSRNGIYKAGRAGDASQTLCMFRFTGSPTIDIIGLTLIDVSYVQDCTPASVVNLSGLSFAFGVTGTNNVAAMFRTALTLIDPKFSGNIQTHLASVLNSPSSAVRIQVYGFEAGVAPLIGKVPDYSGARNWFEGRKIINLTVKNTNNVVQGSVRGLFTDVNNGARYNGTTIGATNFQNSIDYDVATNVSGVSSYDVLLWECAGQLNGTSNVNSNMTVDYRWSNGPTYVITIPLKSYDNLPGSVQVDCGGFGQTVSSTAFVTTDSSVTLSQSAAAALTSIATLDNLYDAAKNWSWQSANFNYPSALTQFVSASGTVLDLGSRNLVVDATAASAFSVNTGTNTVTIKSTVLAAGTKFKSVTTTGSITFANGASASCIYTSSSGTSANLSLSGLTSASVAVLNGAGTVVDYQASVTGTYSLNIAPGASGTWTYYVAKFGYIRATGTFSPGTGGNFGGSVTLLTDTFVVDTLTNVQAYTDLNSVQKAYDYYSYARTTNVGIVYPDFSSKAFGSITITTAFNIALPPPSGGHLLLWYDSATSTVQMHSTGLSDAQTLIVNGNFTSDAGVTLGDALMIRANNIDSEIITSGITSATLYPTEADQLAATNPGPVFGSIFRFKHGATSSGVLMSGTLYARVNVGPVLLYSLTIASGRNTLDLGTAGQLASLNATVAKVKTNTDLIPATL